MIDILAIGAHPDDIEFGCGGILTKMSAYKKTIVMVDMTLGEKGTHGTPHQRKEESLAAAKILGAERIFLSDHFTDCEIFDTYEGRLQLVKVIRTYRPRLILAPLWKGEQNHPDHLACGLMMRYACRYARFSKIMPEIPPHTVDGILHYLYPTFDHADFLVDVSEHVELWKKIINSHKSQMQTEDYCAKVLIMAAKMGALIQKPYAQGLVKGNPIVVDDIMAIAHGAREI